MTEEEHKEFILYCNEWLGIWNEKFLDDHYLPRGNEFNYEIAKQMNDIVTEDIVEGALKEI